MGSSKLKKKYDLLIVGMGLAGVSLAAHLPAGISALVIDAKNATGERPCGGVMMPKASLHPWISPHLDAFASVPASLRPRIIDRQDGREKRFENLLRNIDKHALIEWFLKRIPPGADVRFGTRLTGIRADGGGFAASLLHGEGTTAVKADIIVGADGVNSAVREHFRLPCNMQKHYAMQVAARSDADDPFFNIVVDGEVSEFYAWKIPKKGDHIIGFATRKKEGMAERLELLVERMGCRAFGKPQGTMVGRYWPEREGHPSGIPGVYLIGEAAGHIGYFSEGMSWALRGAECVAGILGAPDARMRYGDLSRQLATELAKQNELFSGFLESPGTRRKMFMLMAGYERFPDF